MTDRTRYIAKLETILNVIKDMTDSEFAILAKQGSLFRPSNRKPPKAPPISSEELSRLASNLRACVSREAAVQILNESKCLETKNNLAKLGKYIGSHIMKHDSRDDICQKIVEGVVGFRLRSEAIHSLDLRRSETNSKNSSETPEG